MTTDADEDRKLCDAVVAAALHAPYWDVGGPMDMLGQAVMNLADHRAKASAPEPAPDYEDDSWHWFMHVVTGDPEPWCWCGEQRGWYQSPSDTVISGDGMRDRGWKYLSPALPDSRIPVKDGNPDPDIIRERHDELVTRKNTTAFDDAMDFAKWYSAYVSTFKSCPDSPIPHWNTEQLLRLWTELFDGHPPATLGKLPKFMDIVSWMGPEDRWGALQSVAPTISPVEPDGERCIDAGIQREAEVLRAAGIETFESCQGGIGHSYPEPTVCFFGQQSEGFKALAVALQNGLKPTELRRYWTVEDREPVGPHWQLVFQPTSQPTPINTSTTNGLEQENAPQPDTPVEQEPSHEEIERLWCSVAHAGVIQTEQGDGGVYLAKRFARALLAKHSGISDEQLLKLRDYARTDSTAQYLTDARRVVGR